MEHYKSNQKSRVLSGLMVVILSLTMTGCIGGLFGSGSTVTSTVLSDGTVVTETTNVNNSNTAAYFRGYEVHVTKDSATRTSMAKSVMTIGDDGTCVGECKGWQEAFKANAIAYGTNFQATPYTLEKPKDLMDVVDSGVKVIGGVLEKGTMVYGAVEFGKALVESKGDTTVTMGNKGSIEGAFHSSAEEVHATVLGEDGQPVATIDNTVDNSDDHSVIPYE